MSPQPSIHLSRRMALSVSLALIGAIMLISGADRGQAYVTPAQASQAADAGAGWFQTEQTATGALPGDWGMTALAAAGLNAADVRTGLIDPSAQDFYVGDWSTADGPGLAATDPERAVLSGSAGGIQASRVSVDRNLVAQVAGFWDGDQIGNRQLLNDDIFGVLALDRVDIPGAMLTRVADHIRTKQLPDGGWSWSNSADATSDTDMTGSAIASLCSTGADPATDPDIQKALEFLRSVQDSNGGFAAPPWAGVNTDSTGWVTSGLIQCGLDPQSAEWITSTGNTPYDYMISMQRPDGRFCWQDTVTCQGSAAYATWDAVRPLAGTAFSAEVPEREVPTEPAVRPAPTVTDGTPVSVALVIDYGNGEADMCEVQIDSGEDLDATLESAQQTADPAGCVSDHSVASGANGDRLKQLNGVVPDADSDWVVSVDGSPQTAETDRPIGFGDLVVLRLDGKTAEAIDPPRVDSDPGPSVERKLTKVNFGGAKRIKLRGRSVKPLVSCPRGQGAEGCRGTVTIRYRKGGKTRTGGQAPFSIRSGTSKRINLKVKRSLLRLSARTGNRKVTLIAATRSPEGAIALTRSGALLTAKRH